MTARPSNTIRHCSSSPDQRPAVFLRQGHKLRWLYAIAKTGGGSERERNPRWGVAGERAGLNGNWRLHIFRAAGLQRQSRPCVMLCVYIYTHTHIHTYSHIPTRIVVQCVQITEYPGKFDSSRAWARVLCQNPRCLGRKRLGPSFMQRSQKSSVVTICYEPWLVTCVL